MNNVENNELRKEYFLELDKEIAELIDPDTGMLSLKYSKYIPCPICEAKEYEKVFVKRGYTFVRCCECELVYTNPQVNEECLNELYGKSKANNIWQQVTKSQDERAWKNDYYREHLNLILENSDVADVSLLDIGCSTGQFLEIASEKLKDVKGIEISDVAFKYCRDELNLDVDNMPLTESKFFNRKFDAVTLFGVLEHLPRPLDILRDIKSILNNKSLVMAIVPNAYSLYHTVLNFESVTFDGRNHLNYFSTKTLRRIFEIAGYEVVVLDTVLDGYHKILSRAQLKANDTDKYLDDTQKRFYSHENISKLCKENNLGLRIRILARKKA